MAILKGLLPSIPIILILVLIVVLIFLTKKKPYILWTLVAVLGVFIIGSGGFAIYKNIRQPFKPLSSTAVFKKMEYIEHLQLVSHYSEEIVLLGTEEKVRKVVKRREKEQKIAFNLINKLQDSISKYEDKINEIYGGIDQKQASLKSQLDSIGFHQDCYKNLLKDGMEKDKKDFSNSCLEELMKTMYDPLIDSLSVHYEKSFTDWAEKKDNFDEKKWKDLSGIKVRWRARRNQKLGLDSARANLKRIHKLFCNIIEARLEEKADILNDAFLNKSQVKSQKKAEAAGFIASLKVTQKAYKDAIKSWHSIQEKLAEAKIELAYAEELGADTEPELLVILPAEVSIYIDMSQIVINEDSLEQGIVYVRLPKPKFDPVQINLPEDSAIYQLDKKKTELETSRDGAYYDLFSQLQESIIELELIVKEKAQSNGIMEEGEKMAKTYLESFISPMGYEIRFDEINSDFTEITEVEMP